MAFQISMVSGILAYKFGATFAWITTLSMAAYIAFTLTVTQVLFLSFLIRDLHLNCFNNQHPVGVFITFLYFIELPDVLS